MRIVLRGLLMTPVLILSLLALENILAFGVMAELGMPRGMLATAVEFAAFVSISAVLIWRGRLWPGHWR